MLSAWTITRKLLVSMMVMAVLAISIPVVIQIISKRDALYSAALDSNQSITVLLAAQSSGGIKWRKEDRIQKVFDDYKKVAPGTALATFTAFDAKGDMIITLGEKNEKVMAWVKDHVKSDQDKLTKGEPLYLPSGKDMVFFAPIMSGKEGDQLTGVVVTLWHTKALRAKVMESIMTNLALGLVILFVLVAAIFYMIQRVFARPVRDLLHHVNTTMGEVQQAAQNMDSMANSMVGAAAQTQQQSSNVKQISTQASENVQQVAAGAEELSSSLTEINSGMGQTVTYVDSAIAAAENSSQVMASLGQASENIQTVTGLIADIAEQTNLLALNASIEAARAGDAGRGFSVVADEIKKLATHTSEATADITNHVNSISDVSDKCTQSLGSIVEAISQIKTQADVILSSVREQEQVTQDITENMHEASGRVKNLSANMEEVDASSHTTGESAESVHQQINDLAVKAKELGEMIHQFEQTI